MNYKKIHDAIIFRAKIRNWTKKTSPCYVERHHIIPKCMGGNPSWRGDNVVCLTAKEHFIIHLLLVKITEGDDKTAMIRALMYFKAKIGSRDSSFKSSKMYQKLREEYALRQSEIGKLAKGRKHSDKSKQLIGKSSKGRNIGRSHTPEAVEKIRKSSTGRIYSIETRQKIKKVRQKDWENRKNRGWAVSEETKLKKSNSLKEYWRKKKLNETQQTGNFRS